MTQSVRYGEKTTRLGMTVNEAGKQATLGGPWPDDWAKRGPDSFIGRVGRLRSDALKIGKRLHDQNETVRLAKMTNKPAHLPEPDVRQKLAQKDQQTLASLQDQWRDIDNRVLKFRLDLRPFNYEGSTAGDVAIRQELRAHLRSQKDEKARLELLKNGPAYKRAAFEDGAPAELSGLSRMVFERLRQEDIAAKFPDQTKAIAEFEQASEIFDRVMDAASAAVNAELAASGATQDVTATTDYPAEVWA